MSYRKSQEARIIQSERRATDRERSIVRHCERAQKRSARIAFGGAR